MPHLLILHNPTDAAAAEQLGTALGIPGLDRVGWNIRIAAYGAAFLKPNEIYAWAANYRTSGNILAQVIFMPGWSWPYVKSLKQIVKQMKQQGEPVILYHKVADATLPPAEIKKIETALAHFHRLAKK